ncbi:MAG: cytochrome C oxidase Cbb3 [Flavobacteriaceae bacterium]|nr:MAG: cytochrome C oxidase Cbb3 [Flavobacteriaceae bacterium]
MKINWGTSIVIAFIGFISFIMYFVITVNTDEKYDYDLVTDEYYKEELRYQTTIDKEKNSKALKQNVTWQKTEKGMLITFPDAFDYKHITGKLFLYRPSNRQLDFEIPISLSSYNLLIPDNRMLDGRWNIYVDWEYQNMSYLFKEELIY